jgi:hypothetical protein
MRCSTGGERILRFRAPTHRPAIYHPLVPRPRPETENDSTVPRAFVRPGGQHGNCFALYYREGATYLLILKSQHGSLTAYWTPLKPTNEQVKPGADEWVEWVRSYVRAVP